MARGTRTSTDFVNAAYEIVATSGWPGLSAKSLAESMHTHSTAVYRHFRNWDELVVAVLDRSLGELSQTAFSRMPAKASPRKRLMTFIETLRAAVDADPFLVDGLQSIVAGREVAPTPAVDAIMRWIVDQLVEMGVPDERIPVLHQALENLLIGFTISDFAAHPKHTSNRRQRRRMASIKAFEASSRTDADCKAVTDEAFALTANLILDECERASNTP